MLDQKVLIFDSTKLAKEVAFQMRGIQDNLNSVSFKTQIDGRALEGVIQQYNLTSEYGENWCFSGERCQKFGYLFSSKWLALIISIWFKGNWNGDNCVYFYPKDAIKIPNKLKLGVKK